jgi:hypothetical protein
MVKPGGLGEDGRLRNPFQAPCKKVVRRSKRRIGQSCYKLATPIPTRPREKRSQFLAKRAGHPFIRSFDAADTRPLINSDLLAFINS